MANSDNQEFKDKYNQNPVFPNMVLWQEIIFLQGYFKGKWLVENVISWYEPLIKPTEFGGHYFWSNFTIIPMRTGRCREHNSTLSVQEERKGFDLSKYKLKDKSLALRNCVEPEVGLHIFKEAQKENKTLF